MPDCLKQTLQKVKERQRKVSGEGEKGGEGNARRSRREDEEEGAEIEKLWKTCGIGKDEAERE